MSSEILREIIEKVDLLAAEERLELIAAVERKSCVSTVAEPEPQRRWSDLIGMLPYPACEEDAQTYICRSRREADEKRLPDSNR